MVAFFSIIHIMNQLIELTRTQRWTCTDGYGKVVCIWSWMNQWFCNRATFWFTSSPTRSKSRCSQGLQHLKAMRYAKAPGDGGWILRNQTSSSGCASDQWRGLKICDGQNIRFNASSMTSLWRLDWMHIERSSFEWRYRWQDSRVGQRFYSKTVYLT